MPGLERACRSIVHNVAGAIACGVVELESGDLLGGYERTDGAAVLGGAVIKRVTHLLRSGAVSRVHARLSQHRGILSTEIGTHWELYVCIDQRLHFLKAIGGGKAAVLLVTDRTANIGMGWAQLRSATNDLEGLPC